MTGTIKNRQSFLQTLTTQYPVVPVGASLLRTVYPKSHVYDELAIHSPKEVFKARAKFIHAQVVEVTKEDLPRQLDHLCEGLTAEQVIASKDDRFCEWGLEEWANERVIWWDPKVGEENIAQTAKAKIGITFADSALAESGTIILLNEYGKGRAVSLLPEIHIVIIPVSSIVPRLTEGMQVLSGRSSIPSCVNFITGPSNSADIESYLVVGVHGPLEVFYILVE